MTRWRIGSFSMGLVLVASGILMLTSMMIRVNVLNILLSFWPIILISLGIEIFIHLFVKKGGAMESKLRYDVLSILFIGFLLVVSAGFYTVTYYASMFDSREDMNAALGIMNENAFVEDSATLDSTKELVVFNDFHNITVLVASDGKLKVEYAASVSTSDTAYAQTILAGAVKLDPGERAYLRSETTAFWSNQRVGWPTIDCVIYLPQDTTLDLSGFRGMLECDQATQAQIIYQ